MNKIIVAYWSQSGNTEAMAQAIASGIVEVGKEVVNCTPCQGHF